MKNRFFLISTLYILVIFFSCDELRQNKQPWHYPLYLAGNDYWRQRIPIVVNNNTQRDIIGDPVDVQIGKGREQIPLVGVLAEGIRVINDKDAELIFRITDQNGNLVERGPIPSNSTITIPVECSAENSQTINYVYFNNPSAWAVGDFLKAESKKNDSISITVLEEEKFLLKESGNSDEWFYDNQNDQYEWHSRASMKTVNFEIKKNKGNLICINIEGIINRQYSDIDEHTGMQVTDGTRPIPYYKAGKYVFFNQDIPAKTIKTNYIYFSFDNGSVQNLKVIDVKNVSELHENAIHYSDFNDQSLSDWVGDIHSGHINVSEDSKVGKGSLKLENSGDKRDTEIKLEQVLPVQTGEKYFIGAWIKTSDKREDGYNFRINISQRSLVAQFIDMEGENVGPAHRLGVIEERLVDFPGTWSHVHKIIEAPADADSVRLQLVNSSPGAVWFDDILFAQVKTGVASAMALERKAAKNFKKLTVWQEDPIVKVFQDDLPPNAPSKFSISVAQNEVEPLQLVILSPEDYEQIQIKVNPPSDQKGNRLEQIDIGVVGYVPINYPSNYYGAKDDPNPWRVKYISRRETGSDGWAGMWPDPILPFQRFNLSANVTQPVWIEFTVPQYAVAGDYYGQIQLVHNAMVIKEIPYKVHVWNFELPKQSNLTAIYDVRGGVSVDEAKEVWKVLADHRLAPNRVMPNPTWEKVNGEIIYDFTEYNKNASYYFDTLNIPHTYPPDLYLFGWGNPPLEKFGEKPYPGEWPYEGADRGMLRPEFVKAYQSAIRAYWNNMKENGWADKVLFYISDEPHSSPEITSQMRTLCNMIHEVDPNIPIYVSSWWHRPEYDGYIDIWGVSNHGSTWGRPVPVEDFLNIKKGGGRLWFTTDGKMCTDTPYLGFERLTPHYAFKYGAEGYEFWGCNWYTFNPYEYGWHSFIRQSSSPGRVAWTRYPNGDGYIIYPGHHIGIDSYVGSIRLKLAREGVEDFEYLNMLKDLIDKGGEERNVIRAQEVLKEAGDLVLFPTAEGRFSTEYLPDPYAVLRIREQVAEAIEGLLK